MSKHLFCFKLSESARFLLLLVDSRRILSHFTFIGAVGDALWHAASCDASFRAVWYVYCRRSLRFCCMPLMWHDGNRVGDGMLLQHSSGFTEYAADRHHQYMPDVSVCHLDLKIRCIIFLCQRGILSLT